MSKQGTSQEAPVHRLFVVDDHPIVRQGLTYLIDAEPDLHVCGQTGEAKQVMRAVGALQPDLVVCDLVLQDSSGLDLLKALHARHPKLPMLVVSMHDEFLYARRVLRAGAHGYVMKQQEPEVLLTAIRLVLDGGIYVSSGLASRIIQGSMGDALPSSVHPLSHLSDRELDVLSFLAQGYDTRAIAHALHLSFKTVWTHRANMMKKLHLRQSVDLVRYAMTWLQRPQVS